MMEYDDAVETLVELFFYKNIQAEENVILAEFPYIPNYLLERRFRYSIPFFLSAKAQVATFRWRKFLDICYTKMYSSHEKFLTFVMFACLKEHEYNPNIFESFISVCGLVEYLCEETLQQTRIDFCNLKPDIVIVFYQSQMRSLFSTCGGCWSLVKYICEHKYLEWAFEFLKQKDKSDMQKYFEDRISEELTDEFIEEINANKIENNASSIELAETVLSNTSVKLPALPSYPELIKRIVAYKQIAKAKKTITEAVGKSKVLDRDVHDSSSTSSESKTNNVAKPQDNIEQYENIIQAITKNNHFRNTASENTRNGIQEEADGILEHLKDTIKSVLKVLDEYDKE